MSLSKEAKLLLSKHPELIREIVFEIGGRITSGEDILGQIDTIIKQQIEPNRNFLSKSEDGIAIYESDNVFVVFTHGEFGFPLWAVTELELISVSNWDETVKVFSFKDNAQSYVLLNKPCLSLRDIENVAKKNHLLGPGGIYVSQPDIIEVAKQKSTHA